MQVHNEVFKYYISKFSLIWSIDVSDTNTTLILLPFCYRYFDEGIVMLESDEGEAFNCDREIGVPLQLKIRVLDRFKAKDLKIRSFVK